MVPRCGAAVATWLAMLLVARRVRGRPFLLAPFAGVGLGLVVAFPEPWVLAAGAVVAATTFGVLGVVATRPAGAAGGLRELVLAVLCGLAGAVAVDGYDVVLHPDRSRFVVLVLALGFALLLAGRVCADHRGLGGLGVLAVVGVIVVLLGAAGYVYALQQWGSAGVVDALVGAKRSVRSALGAWPPPVAAVVGMPALVWGCTVRRRRRSGWWVSAFGALGVASAAMAFAVPAHRPLTESLLGVGYAAGIGAVVGLLLVGMNRLFTGGNSRARRVRRSPYADVPEPGRLRPLR